MVSNFKAVTQIIGATALGLASASPLLSQELPPEKIEATGADKAYVPQKAAEPALPPFPPRPVLTGEGYPDCKEGFQSLDNPYAKAKEINRCTVALDNYYKQVLIPFRERMIDYQNELSALYQDKVAGNRSYSAKNQQKFYADMIQEHKDSNPDGANFAGYRLVETEYTKDRAYLADRFCFNTGCNGYPAPEYVAVDEKSGKQSEKDRNSSKRASKPQKCKGARAGGGLLGGVLGGFGGKAAGLGKIGTAIASGVGAVLVSELACKLTEKEQKKAVEATQEVVKKEEVGATAQWQSPSRSGVSGSSTVTAMNTEPNGRRCLNITDVAIIDGEETRITKQMCRGKGDGGYSIV